MTENERKSSFVEVNGWPVWYEVFGNGPKPVLLIAGAIGTGRSDFYEQLEGDDPLDFDQFTLIAVEAPGWGRSRPPQRKYNKFLYENDSQCFHAVMQHLGYNKYSVIGWSDGAKVALLMAINYRDSVQSLVLSAMSTYVSPNSHKFFDSTKSVETWGQHKIDCYLRSYSSKEEIQKLWTHFYNYVIYYNQYFPEDIYKNKYHLVKCPVLIFHGDRDQMIDVTQPQHVCNSIRKGTLHRIAGASHNLHQKYSQTFKLMTERHILGTELNNNKFN